MFGSLPSHDSLMNEATKLNKEAKDLKTKAVDVAGRLELDLGDAKRLEVDADQVNCPHRDNLSGIRLTNCWMKK